MIKGNGGNKRVDGGQRESFRATDAENSSRFAVRGQAERLEHVPLRKMTLDWSTSRLRPCKVSETITPERAKGSASAIIRRSSVPARLGEGRRSRPQQKYRPESNPISPRQLVVPLPDTTAMVMENTLAILRTDEQLQSSINDFALCFQAREFLRFANQCFVNVDVSASHEAPRGKCF